MRKGRTRRRAQFKVGLFGGSFNPAHAGHLHASLLALKRIGLDQVWWLVSPGNPLKDKSELEDYAQRCAAARRLAAHPHIRVSTFEHDAGLVYTQQTLAALRQRFPGIAFVWVMGADNLADIHRWQHWTNIFETMPIAVIDRPGYRFAATTSKAAARFAAARLDETDAPLLPYAEPPAWCFLSGPLVPVSSTEIRKKRKKAK